MTTNNMEARREAFEAWASSKGWRIARRYDAASTDEYMAYETQQRWECWNAALDSICVELPLMDSIVDEDGFMHDSMRADEVKKALNAAGVAYK